MILEFRFKRTCFIEKYFLESGRDSFLIFRKGAYHVSEFARRPKPKSTEALSSINRSPNLYGNMNGYNNWFSGTLQKNNISVFVCQDQILHVELINASNKE